jgi:hypothetical protein
MRKISAVFLVALLFMTSFASAKVIVFWQDGFPTIASQPVPRATLVKALSGMDPVFAGIDALRDPAALSNTDLLVLPYGSATPVDIWSSIRAYLHSGGNLLIIGGQPFYVPVRLINGKFNQERPQDTYAHELNFRHTYELPRIETAKFEWRTGYSFLQTPEIRARRFFAVEGALLGHGLMTDVRGLGYMVNSEGDEVAAPVIVADHTDVTVPEQQMLGARMVMLDFDPEPGYWESADGVSLIRQTAAYARQGATLFWTETLFSTLKPGEPAQAVVHLRNARRERLMQPQTGEVKLDLLSGNTVLESAAVICSGSKVDATVYFHKAVKPGFYTLRAIYEDGGQPREFYQNGFWVEDEKLLASGPVLDVKGDFLTRDGKPYFPVGTNYFTTEDQNWDFSGPRNAWVWERDFADMARHGVTFVRTGVWTPYMRFVEPTTAEVNERFLRNLEAFLLSARRHDIVVNFTFFAFAPGMRDPDPSRPVPNPYTDPTSIRAEQDYMLSVVNRFKQLPWLSWDLINEPSFSNPRRLWKGNTPNGDATELAAWRNWLRQQYRDLTKLASAWSVTPESLGSFDAVPLPSIDDLTPARYGNFNHVRAVDYNLFAQDRFTRWVQSMVTAIRSTGSKQLINVGQDEGGVADRVLNQFYASGGVSFTTNHTYWRDDHLLWNSLVAKRVGVPNILGETGYQPVWAPDGAWRYDELTGFSLMERKWAFGFAAANSGMLQWDWAREVDFGMKRTDGSAKIWQSMMRDMGQFAQQAAPWATGLIAPQVAIVLPQSAQLSIYNSLSLEAQQKSVRALYNYARAEAYAVGEYQIELLGSPKLIIVPSPLTLTDQAWNAIVDKVRGGATLLLSGRFDNDAHFHSTARQQQIGLNYEPALLTLRENILRWPGGSARLSYGGDKTTYLDRAVLPDHSQWAERTVGKGKILFAALPLELNDNLQAIGDVYRYALKIAGVAPTYTTDLAEPGLLICPTRFPHATLYVLASESGAPEVAFRDQASGQQFSGRLEPGRAALLLVRDDGTVVASYNWK